MLEIVQAGERVTVYVSEDLHQHQHHEDLHGGHGGHGQEAVRAGLDQTLLECLLRAQKLEIDPKRQSSRVTAKYYLHQRSLYGSASRPERRVVISISFSRARWQVVGGAGGRGKRM